MRKPWTTVADIMRRYALYSALMVALAASLTSCGDDKVEINKYENVTTTLVEYEAGRYKIESDEPTTDTISHLMIKHIDGKVEEMPFSKVKEQYGDKDPMDGYTTDVYAEDEYGEEQLVSSNPNPNYYNHPDSDIWFILWWSSYGYHLGRPYNTPIYSGYYYTPSAYTRASATSTRMVSTRTTVSVPRTSTSAPIRSSTSYGGSSSRGYSAGSHGGSYGG